MNCSNCNAQLSCGCQTRTASDGKQVCTNCINVYENKLKEEKEKEKKT
jgi:hypothetical protein